MKLNFLNNKSGNVAVPFAIALMPMLLAGGAAFEYSEIRRVTTDVQQSLDGALISVAKNFNEDVHPSVLGQHGQVFLDSNLGNNFPANVTFNYMGNPNSAQAVQFGVPADKLDKHLLAKAKFTYRSNIGLFEDKQIERHTVVAVEESAVACVLALHRTSSRVINISGSTTVDVTGCTLAANSNSESAIFLGGAGTLTAECLRSSGGISASESAMALECNKPATNAARISDPYADLKMPLPGPPIDQNGCGMGLGQGGAFNSCLAGSMDGDTLNIGPGTYDGLDVKDKLHLAPGNYIITGPIKINATAQITGTGVTIFIAPTASMTINGSASVNLVAPTTGTYQGFLFAALPGYTQTLSMNGSGDISMTGIIYAPESEEVIYSGNSSAAGECVRIVAATISFTGNSKFKADCSSEIPQEPMIYDGVRIVF